MRAGGLKYRLQVYEPVKAINKYGEEVITWNPTNIIRAERAKLSGNRNIEVGEMFPSYDAEFNVRDAHSLKENWRVEQLGGNLYSITNIVPNIDKGYNTLQCDRVNE